MPQKSALPLQLYPTTTVGHSRSSKREILEEQGQVGCYSHLDSSKSTFYCL